MARHTPRECLGLGRSERGEDRAQRGPLHPLQHGFGAVQHLDVGRLPRGRHEPGLAERLEVVDRVVRGGPRPEPPVEERPPRLRRGELAQEHVRRLTEVAGHLQREDATWREEGREPTEQLEVVRDPLQGSVRQKKVDGAVRLEGPDGAVHELETALDFETASLGEHLGRVVDTDDPRQASAPPARP